MQNVFVLDGGLPAWGSEGGPVDRCAPAHPLPCVDASWDDLAGDSHAPTPFWRSKSDVLQNLVSPSFTIVDARSDGRFSG